MRRAAASLLVACSAPAALSNSAGPSRGLAIHLERTECMGNECPTYTIDIAGDGAVTWTGGDHVLVHGSAHAQIPPRDVARIVDAFRHAKFFALDRAPKFYVDCSLGKCIDVICETTDSSTTKIEIDHHALELFDCRGELAAAVNLLYELGASGNMGDVLDRAHG